jgi:hypothetical protein
MVVAVGVGAGLVALLRNVDFAADYGLDTFRFRGVVKLDRAKQIAVIRHGNGRHLLLGDHIHELVDFAGPVEQGVVGVVMKVNEWSFGHRTERMPKQLPAGGDSSILSPPPVQAC